MALSSAFMTACSIGQSYILGLVTDEVISGQREQVEALLILLMSLWLVAPAMQCVHHLCQLYASQNLRIGVTDHLTARIMYAQPRRLSESTVGNIVERIEIAAGSLHGFVETVSTTVVKLLSVALLVTLVLSGLSISLGFLAGAWIISALLLSTYLAYTGMKNVEDASDAHARVISEIAEIITNVPIIRSFTTQQFERSRFWRALRGDLLACRRVRSYWLFVLLIETLYKWGFGIALTAYIADQYSLGGISLPQLITVLSLIIALSWHFESVTFHFVEMFEYFGHLRASLTEITNVPIDAEASSNPLPLPQPGQINLHDCTVRYGRTVALREVTFHIAPGTKVGIVGPSGSGKSTLLAMLRGEVQVTSGSVKIHGLPLSSHSVGSLAAASSEASQSALMFNRTVSENVAYGRDAIDRQHVMNDAIQHARAQPFVANLPHGINTVVGERGSNISTGERQRLSIARALIKQSPLFIFDEATASIDAVSEEAIFSHLLNSYPDSTVLAVSHRIIALSGFDLIVVMEKGRVVDIGSPADLKQRCALYQQLMNAASRAVEEKNLDFEEHSRVGSN